MTYRLPRDPVGIRTPNLRIRSAMLYPVELQSQMFRRNGGQRYQLTLNGQMVLAISVCLIPSTSHRLSQFLRQSRFMHHYPNGVMAEIRHGNKLLSAVYIALTP